MNRHRIIGSVFLVLWSFGSALAQDQPPPVPPDNALKLSEIVAKIEARDQFRYVSEINWDDEGFYNVIYFTTDKAKVEMKIDPATGQPK